MSHGSKSTRNVVNVPKRLYSIDEAAHYLGRSSWAVREMLWAGKMPFIKDGRRVLVDVQDMNVWIEKSKSTYTF